jgi:hypothetical protein
MIVVDQARCVKERKTIGAAKTIGAMQTDQLDRSAWPLVRSFLYLLQANQPV